MRQDLLLEKIQEVVARECSMYTERPIEKERCAGAACRILWLLKEYEAAQKTK